MVIGMCGHSGWRGWSVHRLETKECWSGLKLRAQEEGGWSWGKGVADICCKSHASPSKGIVLYWGSVWSQGELPAYLN